MDAEAATDAERTSAGRATEWELLSGVSTIAGARRAPRAIARRVVKAVAVASLRRTSA